MTSSIDWDLVKSAARELGVRDKAIEKWRQRGVPPKWWLPIARRTGGKVSLEALEEFAA